MDEYFRVLGGLMDRTAQRGTQPSTPKHEANVENDKLDAFFDFDQYAATKHDAEEGKAHSSPGNNLGVALRDNESECSSLTEVSDVSALDPDIATTGPPKHARKADGIKTRLRTSLRKPVDASVLNYAMSVEDQTARNKSMIKWLVGVREAV
jgi:hypothetical protein